MSFVVEAFYTQEIHEDRIPYKQRAVTTDKHSVEYIAVYRLTTMLFPRALKT